MGMKHIENDFWAAELIAEWLAGDISRKGDLDAWLAESAGNRALFDRITSEHSLREHREKWDAISVEKGWAQLRGKVRGRRRTVRRWIAAASVAAMIAVIVAVRFGGSGETTAPVEPGMQSATLILPSGERVNLADTKGAIGTGAFNSENTISYTESDAGAQADAGHIWHHIEIPCGSEYRLALDDGTLVHLNSMSSLRYPAGFGAGRREVELEGEAWFEVSRDEARPFIVHTSKYDIEVLGTQFNVSDYTDDPISYTTLVSGSVRIDGLSDEGTVLEPGQQFSYDNTSGSYSVAHADAAYAAPWRDGRLIFRDQRLEDIMRALGRWYGVEAEYSDPGVGDMRFGLSLSREENIDRLLSIFEENGRVSIERRGNKVIIKRTNL